MSEQHVKPSSVSTPPTFGERVAQVRELRGMTIEELAALTGWVVSTMVEIEQGCNLGLTPRVLAATIAPALGVDIDWLAYGEAGDAQKRESVARIEGSISAAEHVVGSIEVWLTLASGQKEAAIAQLCEFCECWGNARLLIKKLGDKELEGRLDTLIERVERIGAAITEL